MTERSRGSVPASAADRTPLAQELKGDIDSGRTGDKTAFFDPAASPLGTDDEAAGTPDSPDRVATAIRQEMRGPRDGGRAAVPARRDRAPATGRTRPRSPNIQIYRPQLTSVLSIANRISGIALGLGAVGLVAWLAAAASGPRAFAVAQSAAGSWIGQATLLGLTYALFLHLCGGIRHLVWDTVHGLDLRAIYLGGWTVVASSVVLTLAAWFAGLYAGG
ncbi:succinate dehydrogenase, cytochrome b556 subunit [Methylobacterium fujisawaense]|uniref:succinate dehydrogenase, cytochrome b556 subunit n=1 Tax=Methylobacterium fujisawaense TaxID=107400 RepID=UPI00313B7B1A